MAWRLIFVFAFQLSFNVDVLIFTLVVLCGTQTEGCVKCDKRPDYWVKRGRGSIEGAFVF